MGKSEMQEKGGLSSIGWHAHALWSRSDKNVMKHSLAIKRNVASHGCASPGALV